MKKTVFISSTFEDLAEHRRAIWDLLEEFDVRVRGMEKFGARKESPLETSLSEVESSDIYAGVIAFRLGSIDKNSGKSITQLEYEKASELKKEILIYLIDEENSDVKIKYVDHGIKRDKLEAFKKILKEERTVAKFITKDDLIVKLKRDMERVLEHKEQKEEIIGDVYEKSAQIIERLFLAPLSFSGQEIKLQIHIESKPFASSKEICEAFNLKFGATIGVEIKILNPEGFDNFGLNELYMSPKQFDDLLPFIENKKITIYARPQFSGSKIEEIRASFKPRIVSHIMQEMVHSLGTRIVPADGKIVFLLSEIENKSTGEKRTN